MAFECTSLRVETQEPGASCLVTGDTYEQMRDSRKEGRTYERMSQEKPQEGKRPQRARDNEYVRSPSNETNEYDADGYLVPTTGPIKVSRKTLGDEM